MILRVVIAQVLNNHLRKAEAAHKRLTSAKCKLEHNISVKITSINIEPGVEVSFFLIFHGHCKRTL